MGGKNISNRRNTRSRKTSARAALASLDKTISKERDEPLLYRERAQLYLFLGRTQEARTGFDTVIRLEEAQFRTKAGRLHSNLEYDGIGVTYWIEGHRELAVAFWRYTTKSLLENRVSYARQGGGIESGLLLWFAAVWQRRPYDARLVRKLFDARRRSAHWAHKLRGSTKSIVDFFFGDVDEEVLLAVPDRDNESAGSREQRYCEACFAAAIRARENRRHARSRDFMRQSAPERAAEEGVSDFYNVWPYFLARDESAVSR